MLAESIRPIGAVLDPERVRRAAHDIERAARELEPPDISELVRSLNQVPDRLSEVPDQLGQVPDRLDEAIADAGVAVREAMERLPLRRQRRSRRPKPVQVAFVALGVGAIAFAGWLALRWRAAARARAEETRLDAEALERAADEGMATSGTTAELHVATETAAPSGAAVMDPAAQAVPPPVDDLFRPTVGSGLAADR